MSVIPSFSTVLSLLSFLTTVFALARVGAAAFSVNQTQDSSSSSSSSPSTQQQQQQQHQQQQRPWIAYSKATQPAAHLLQLQLAGPGSGTGSGSGSGSGMSMAMTISQVVRFGWGSTSRMMMDRNEKEREKDGVGYIGGHDLVRMPASTWSGMRRPGLLFRPPSPFPDQTKPLSMAKLIMSRHQNQRRTNRPPTPVRRPPGLPSMSSSRSRLVEEV